MHTDKHGLKAKFRFASIRVNPWLQTDFSASQRIYLTSAKSSRSMAKRKRIFLEEK
jgi:hypothetical protein